MDWFVIGFVYHITTCSSHLLNPFFGISPRPCQLQASGMIRNQRSSMTHRDIAMYLSQAGPELATQALKIQQSCASAPSWANLVPTSLRPARPSSSRAGTQSTLRMTHRQHRMIAALCPPICLSQRNLRTAIIEGSLEVKLPTIWTDETQRWEKSGKEEKRREEKRRDETRRDETRREEKEKKKEDQRREILIVFFQWFVAPEGRKVGSRKRRVQSHLARWEMKKLHAVVARSTFPSQNLQNTSCSGHF